MPTGLFSDDYSPDLQAAVSSHGVSSHSGESKLSDLLKGANHIFRATLITSSNPNDLPKFSPPNIIALEIRTSVHEFGQKWGKATFSP